MRVSSTARYTTSFSPNDLPAADASTVVLYRFEEGVGTTVHDASSLGHDLSLFGPTWISE